MADEIGGYFARLRLIVDQEDFNQGIRSLSMLTMEVKQTSDKSVAAKDNWATFMNGLATSIYTIKNVAAALKDMYGAMVGTNKLTFAQSNAAAGMGIGAKDFQGILNGGSAVGISPAVTQASLQAFKKEMSDIRATGNLNTGQGAAQALLGLHIADESKKSPQQGVTDIVDAALARAKKDGDPGEARVLLSKAAGGAAALAESMFDALRNPVTQARGLHKAEDVFNRGNSLNFMTNGGITGASQYTLSLDALNTATGSIGKEAAGDIGGALAPLNDTLTKWLLDHKDEIISDIQGIAGGVARIVSFLDSLVHKETPEETVKRKARDDEHELYTKWAHGEGGLSSPNISVKEGLQYMADMRIAFGAGWENRVLNTNVRKQLDLIKMVTGTEAIDTSAGHKAYIGSDSQYDHMANLMDDLNSRGLTGPVSFFNQPVAAQKQELAQAGLTPVEIQSIYITMPKDTNTDADAQRAVEIVRRGVGAAISSNFTK